MSPAKRLFTFALSDELKRLLQEILRRDGIAEAEQIRRGLRLWFESKGYRFDEDGRLTNGGPPPKPTTGGPKKRSVTKKPKS